MDDIIQDDNTWRSLLKADVRDDARLVDVTASPRESQGVYVKMHGSAKIPAVTENNDVVLFFPNTKRDRDAIVDTRRYATYASLDRDVDKSLKASTVEREGSLPFAIYHGGFFYRFWAAQTHRTYYVIWMTEFTQYNNHGPLTDDSKVVPVVFEMDGRGNVLGITPLCYTGHDDGSWGSVYKPEKYITRINLPLGEIFTCEVVDRGAFRVFAAKTVDDVGGRQKIKNVHVDGMDSLHIPPSVDLELEGLK